MKRLFLQLLFLLSATSLCAADWPVLKTYEGAFLDRVKMPLGGIGTGTISLSGRGGLVDWEIFNEPSKGFVPATSSRWPPICTPSFVLRCETAEGTCAARLLEGPLPLSAYEGDLGSRAVNAGFPRFGKVVFKAAYPLAQVELSEGGLPVEAVLEAMNPLVPGDAWKSGIPAVLLRWRLTNRSAQPVKASVAGTLVNCCGRAPRFADRKTPVIRDEARVQARGLTGIRLSGRQVDSRRFRLLGGEIANAADGEFGLFVPEGVGTVSAATDVREPGWGVAMDRFWSRFVARGDVADTAEDKVAAPVKLPLAQLAVAIELAPGETKSVPVVLAWRFPNRFGWEWNHEEDVASHVLGNWYATKVASAADAAAALWHDLPELEAATVAFVRRVLSAQAPDVVKEAALFNLSTLRTETCFRTADGNFYGWEGCLDDEGSCYGNCTHVWGYEHCLVDLWPELAKSMLDNAFGAQLAANGHMRFRVKLPLAENAKELGTACADGQMQCIVKAYGFWRKTGDDAALRQSWPDIRRALSFAWIPGGWDADRDGVMEGCQHNTMDVEYYGPNPQIEFLYLAALDAAARLADVCGDAAFAATCRDLRRRGSEWTERNLFNGAYYEQRVTPPQGPIAAGLQVHARAADALADPDFQLGAGCLVDQLLGDYAAQAVGLRPVADDAHARTALATVLARCRQRSDGTFNPMRSYALGDEVSLKMAWYPDDRFPRSPFPYYRETMTGFEYVVAALLAWRGDRTEAERVVRDIRNRYDGRKRNPFDEAECGHHYARALAAWTVLKAMDPGFEVTNTLNKKGSPVP